MNKKSFFIIVLLLVFSTLFAVDAEVFIADAKQTSSVFQGYEINHQNTLINQQQRDLNGVSVSVTSGIDYKEKETSLASSNLTVTVPDVYDDIKLVFNTKLSQIAFNADKPFTVSPSISVSKDITINGFEDSRADIEDLKSELQTEVNYKTTIYNFENALINSIISIMQAESRLKDSEISYKRSLNSYQNDKKLGSIEDGSLTDIEQKMRLESTRVSLDSLRNSYEKSLKDFYQQYGIEYQKITSVRDADLSFAPNPVGNSTVLVALYNLDSAKQDLAAVQTYANTLSLSGTASSNISSKSGNKQHLYVNASAKYTAKSWNVSATVSDSFGADLSGIPTVSIAGTWSSNTTKTHSDELNIQKLNNSILEKENSYNTALYNYNTNAQNLLRDIETYKNDVEQLKIQTDYHKTILDYQTVLYEKGLIAKQSLDDAQTTYDKDLSQAVILKLQALVLENKIKTIEL